VSPSEPGRPPARPPAEVDVRAELLRAVRCLAHPTDQARGSTSDLSIDEALMLHSVGWEPIDLICGVSLESIPYGVWNWGSGEIGAASAAQTQAVQAAADRLREECLSVSGYGVVGVRVELEVHRHHADAVLVGTAVRPADAKRAPASPFVSDLSARDFALLASAGWEPMGLAFGTSFVYAPRRSVGKVLSQKTQNVELTNFTEAMYSAREAAMERMQSSAITVGATGVVAVRVEEGPMPFAHHSIRFTAWGTAVRPGPSGHRRIAPQVVVSVNDARSQFEASALRD